MLKKKYSSKRLIGRLIAILALAYIGLGGLSLFSKRPDNLGAVNGRLAECPDSPNCVSSQTSSSAQQLPPLKYAGDPAAALEKIKQIVKKEFPRSRLVTDNQGYLHFEFVSFLFRFVDDVEFVLDATTNQIHFRSASRVGHSDLGVNRSRMMKISQEFNQ